MGVSCPLILKLIAASILLIALVLGYYTHFQSPWTQTWNAMDGKEQHVCIKNDTCPSDAIVFELLFLAITTLCMIISIILIMIEACQDKNKIRYLDAGYHVIAGIAVFGAGILIWVAAFRIDDPSGKAEQPKTEKEKSIQSQRREDDKFFEKLGAGLVAMIDGIIYVVAYVFLWKSS